MAIYDGSIRIDTRVDSSGFNSGLKTITSGFGTITKAAGALGLAITAAFAVNKLVDFGKQAIQIASNLQEVQNVVETAFGNLSYMIEEFADTAIEKFGMSKLTAKQTASTFMAMAKGMGLNSQAAAEMSINMTGLVGDMASFYNVSHEVAATALKSIWTGETETLKQFGVVMTQANLQQYAYTQGINKKISAMSQAELVQLRYKYVMEQLGMVQGDFAKTSGSWANQVRMLSENWKELLGILGEGLITVLTPVVQFLNEIVKALVYVAKGIKAIIQAFDGMNGLEEKNNSVGDSAIFAADGENDFADGINNAASAAKKALAKFDELDVLQNSIGGGSNVSFGDFAIPNISTLKENIDDSKKQIELYIAELNNKTADFVIQPVIEPVVVPLPEPVYEPNWGLNPNPMPEPNFPQIPNPVYIPNWGLVPSIVPLPVFPLLPEPIYEPNWNLNNTLQLETDLVYGTITSFGEQLLKRMEICFSSLPVIYEKALSEAQIAYLNFYANFETLKNTISTNTIEWLTSTIANIQIWKQNTTTAVYDAISNIITNINTGLTTAFVNMALWINSTSDNLVTWGEGVSKIVWETAKNMVSNFLNGLKTMWENFKELMGSIGESLSDVWNENKSWLVPTIAVAGVVAAGAAIMLSGGTLAAPLAAGATGIAAAIPLATGAVIPPNQQFMAILGDQKSGRNLEAPEGLIRQIMREELAGLKTDTDITINFEGNLAQLARVLNPVITKEQKRVGTSLKLGGAFA